MALKGDSQSDNTGNPGLDRPSSSRLALLVARLSGDLVSFVELERDQWIIWIAVAFAGGSVLYFSLLSEPGIAIGPLAILAISCLIYAFPTNTMVLATLGILLSMSGGFTAAKLKTEWMRAPVLKTHERIYNVTGTVEQVEPRKKSSVRLTLKPIAIGNLRPRDLPARIRVTVNARLAATMAVIGSNDIIKVRASLNPPSGPVIPGGNDFSRYAWFKGIGAVGYALNTPTRVGNNNQTNAFNAAKTWIRNLRATISKRIQKALPGETGAIATALITGHRGGISEPTNDAYRGAGIYHILAISGLHMAIMAGSVFFIVRFGLALIPTIALSFPIKKWAAVAAIVGALCYLAISGGAFSTIRSFIMISIMFAAILLDRPALALRNVALAALVILIIYPEGILNPGFQMSFAAVTALIAGFETSRRWFKRPTALDYTPFRRWFLWPLATVVLSTLIASAAVTPVAVFHFHNAQHYAVLANIMAMPVCNIIVMPGALATLVAMPFGLEEIPLFFMGQGIDLMTHVANWVSNLPGATSAPSAMASHVFAIMVSGGLFLAIIRQSFRLAGAAVIALGIAIFPGITMPEVLIGRNADLVAIRQADGRLSARIISAPFINRKNQNRKRRNPPYELSRWMEHFGDTRPPVAALTSPGFYCDRLGCTTRNGEILTALTKHPAGAQHDCERADILILNSRAPRPCARPKTIIDKAAVRRFGSHAIYIQDDGAIKLMTVNQTRGRRPWVQPQ